LKLIGFIGMPGSGKGEASQVARSMGIFVAVMGDVIREEASRLGLEPTDENLGKVGNALRSKEGPQVVARRTFERARGPGRSLAVVDGIRSKEEVEYFRACSEEFLLVEVWASPEERLKWITARGRPDDPKAEASELARKSNSSCNHGQNQMAEALERRECRELNWGMNEAIKMADIRLKNEAGLVEFRRSIRKLLESSTD
jgi:dephospho-CoA kinase